MTGTDNKIHKPIRVCFVALEAYPLFNPTVEAVFGGAEVDLYYLATELAKDKDFEVSFVVGDYGQEPMEIREGITLIKCVDVKHNLFLGSRRIWKALRSADASSCLNRVSAPDRIRIRRARWIRFFCREFSSA